MSRIPSWSQKQELLYGGKGSREERLRLAGDLIAGDRHTVAIDFLEVDPDPELLEKVIDRAREVGDAFLYRRAMAAAGRVPSSREWEAVATRAESLGKESFARMARQAAAAGKP